MIKNLNLRACLLFQPTKILSNLNKTTWKIQLFDQKYSSISRKVIEQKLGCTKTQMLSSRNFRYKIKNWRGEIKDVIPQEKLHGRGIKEDMLKTVFAEGYFAGKVGAKSSWPWKIIITAFLGGIVIGIFLPAIILSTDGISNDSENDIIAGTKKIRTTFADVKGIDEVRQELEDIVEYLRQPLKFIKLGAKLPKGILLVGPPGTGKTLLARALAGEAGVPYFQMSGSEFEQTYVGEGARKLRELFKIAKRCSPCVIFIDEIDSIGSKRFYTPLHPHANQTINQLLTEMDGFCKSEGVIILAATNRKDDLDEALLRPGRFDIEVFIPPPNFDGRKEILQYYLGQVVAGDINVDEIARGTVGFTGADIENMVNRAALRAGLSDLPWITNEYLLEERDRLLMGPAKKSRIPEPQSNRITAYHEAGHCAVAFFTPNSQPIHKVTILPRGNSLGHTAYLPEEEEFYVTKAQLLANLDSLLGGRVAEELIFGENNITTGATSDLKIATEIAKHMVTNWGMSSRTGLQTEVSGEFSPAKKEQIDEEVRLLLQESYERAKGVLQKHSKEHRLLAEALLQYETLDASQINEILSKKKKL